MMRLSRTVSSRSSVSSWGTSPIRDRIFGPSVTGSSPRMRSVPPSRGDMHEIMRIVDVFPAPYGRRNPKHSPRVISKVTRSTATRSPKRFSRSRAQTTGSAAPSGRVPSAPVEGSPRGCITGQRYRPELTARDGGPAVAADRSTPGRAFIVGLPKAEVHLHLEGCLPAEIVTAAAARHGSRAPVGGRDGRVAVASLAELLSYLDWSCGLIDRPEGLRGVARAI